MKIKFLGFTAWIFTAVVSIGTAQNNCPSFLKSGKFDTLTYIKTEIPTDSKNSKVSGNIYLGQGNVKIPNRPYINPVYIPSNKPTWALAVAHAWNYHRNIIKRANYPQIGYFLATALQETELGCVPGATWDTQAKTSPSQVNAAMTMANSGCYQLEGPYGGGYSVLSQAYPINRFPSVNATAYNTLVQSATGFETSSVLKSYYDINTSIIFNYNVGWKFFESIDCTTDKYAYIKSTASSYNSGFGAFANNASFFNRSHDTDANWNLTSVVPNYSRNVAAWTSVLENDVAYTGYATGSSFDSYYNANISWTNVTDYLNIIKFMYPEIDFATAVTPKVMAAFVKIAGSTTATVPFMKSGQVIDQIILALPAEYPTATQASVPSGTNLTCSGATLPYGHIEVVNGSTNLSLGQSVTLKIVVDNNGGPAPTFKWLQGTTVVSTNAQFTINPAATGNLSYTAQICNGTNCYQINTNSISTCLDPLNNTGIQVKSTQASSTCTMAATATVTNVACKGMKTGEIVVHPTNSTASSLKITYTGITSTGPASGTFTNVSGTIASFGIKNLRDGSYNITIEDAANSSCKAYTSAVVDFTTSSKEYVDAKQVSKANCIANLQADIVRLPAPCKWTVQTWVPTYVYWEENIFVGIKTAGNTIFDSWNKTYPAPSIFDQYTNAQVSESIIYLNTGEVIDLSLAALSGANQSRAYSFRILDENGAVVKTFNAPANSAISGSSPYKVGSYTAACLFTPTAHTFSWSPSITSQTDTPAGNAVKSLGNVSVSPITDATYTVSATNKTNTQCVSTDTIIVVHNQACTPACVVPAKPTVVSSGGSGICSGTTTNLSVTLQSGKYYLWYKDDAAIGNPGLNINTLNAQSTAGVYKVRIAQDGANMNSPACYIESDGFTLTVTPTGTGNCVSTDMNDATTSKMKELVKAYNIFGQEIELSQAHNGIFILQYADGSREKVFKQ